MQDENYKQLNLQHWFPTTIGVVDCPFINEIVDDYIPLIKDMKFNRIGFSYHQVHLDYKFNRLNTWITEQVNQYAKMHKFPKTYEAGESWVIDYQKGKGQPWHTHIGWTMSTVFYLTADENDMGTKFRSPVYSDMANPLEIKPIDDGETDKYNVLTFPTCVYKPVQGRLLIFRSYLEHSMANKESIDRRIIFSYNFNSKK